MYIITVLCLLSYSAHGFSAGIARRSQPVALSAVVPRFDLAAIEAFEAELLAQEEAMMMNSTTFEEEEVETISEEELQKFVVPVEFHNKRIDGVLPAMLGGDDVSRSICGAMISNGLVSVKNKKGKQEVVTRKSYKVTSGHTIQVQAPQKSEVTDHIVPQDIPLDILWEDEHMVVINKAAKMVVHPGAGNWDGTVCNAMAHYLKYKSPYDTTDTSEAFEDNLRPGIVHRLDKGTTGVLVIAKSPSVLGALSAQFANRTVQKTYLSIAVGNPGRKAIIDKPIGRHPIHRQKMRVDPEGGRRALSRVDTLAFNGQLSLARVQIATGRTHQIRVHLQDRGTPVCGDDVYGLRDWNQKVVKRYGIRRPLLHAYQLQLQHPVTKEMLALRAPVPDDMRRMIHSIDPELASSIP